MLPFTLPAHARLSSPLATHPARDGSRRPKPCPCDSRCWQQDSNLHICASETQVSAIWTMPAGADGRSRTCTIPLLRRTPLPVGPRRQGCSCATAQRYPSAVRKDGFEPPTTCSQGTCATKLRHFPTTARQVVADGDAVRAAVTSAFSLAGHDLNLLRFEYNCYGADCQDWPLHLLA